MRGFCTYTYHQRIASRGSSQTAHTAMALDLFLVAFVYRLSQKSIKAYATIPIGIMGRKSLALID